MKIFLRINFDSCSESFICLSHGFFNVDDPTRLRCSFVFLNFQDITRLNLLVFLIDCIVLLGFFFQYYAAFLFLFFLIYLSIAIIAAGVTPETLDAAPKVGVILDSFSIISFDNYQRNYN